MPVLGIGGSGSFGPIIGDHLRHVATNVHAVEIENGRALGGRGAA